jgi:uncharacterized protein
MAIFPSITLITVAGLALLSSVLAIQVIVQRVRLKIESGDGGHQEMAQAVRAHANFSEHVPIALLALGAYEIAGGQRVLLLACAGALILARLLSAIGLSRSLGPSIPRQAGASITLLVTIVCALAALIRLVPAS